MTSVELIVDKEAGTITFKSTKGAVSSIGDALVSLHMMGEEIKKGLEEVKKSAQKVQDDAKSIKEGQGEDLSHSG